ncbi:MAG: GntR family transcriptional regulator [Proteobacteria bacterium]|nr:GntR family transcriptional regulator [Pseudomonadota bacterium]
MSSVGQQRHEAVIDTLIVQIFNRELKPGEKLPTERELSKQFNVDRTSLRVALKQLQSMHIIDIRQGDGMYVKDYLEYAGIDFLDRLFLMDFNGKKDTIIDGYIHDELWEFWIEFLPTMLVVAAKNFTTRNIKEAMSMLDEELKYIDDKSKVVEIELRSQEMVAKATNNIMFILMTNASRQVRRKMLKNFVATVGLDTVKEHIQLKKNMLNAHFAGSVSDMVNAAGKYKEVLQKLRVQMRKTSTQQQVDTVSDEKPDSVLI